MPNIDDKYYTVKEAADMLKVSPSLIYKLIYTGRLKVVRVGSRTIRVPARSLMEAVSFFEEGKPQSEAK